MTHTFHHPKYYKELRTRNKLDQVISKEPATAGNQRAPGPGLKPQAPSVKPSSKRQANQNLVQVLKLQAASPKRQATSFKLNQATSYKLPDP